jgi:Zn-finger nucleic acid-binding protein
MVVVEFQRIELDYCTKCLGVWFDGGELELLLERMALDGAALTVDEIMALHEEKVAEKARRCPICRRKMRKVVIGSEPRVLIDVCPQRDGIWFDRGELSQVMEQLRSTEPTATGKHKHRRVIHFLGEVFKAKG